MKNKKYILFSLILLCNLANFCALGLADSTREIYSSKDTYVSAYDPTSNYGGQEYLYCGYIYEAFLYFNLSSVPTGWNKVELYLDISLVSKTVDFDIYKIAESWKELSLTYENKPEHSSKLLTFQIADDVEWTEDVTAHVSGKEFSISIYSSDLSQHDDVWISSREDSSESRRPKLIFTYPTTSTTPTDFSALLTFGAIVGSIALALILLVVFKPKTQPIQLQPQPQQPPPPAVLPPISPPPIPKTTVQKFCSNCGTEIVKPEIQKYCSSCGSKLD